jgi:hypothetical protein
MFFDFEICHPIIIGYNKIEKPPRNGRDSISIIIYDL